MSTNSAHPAEDSWFCNKHAVKWMLRLACGCIAAGSAFAWQARDHRIERLYIEPFATKAGAEKLQEDLTSELRKLSSVSLVPEKSSADVILGGGGEIWIKGYRSLNPRSGRLPSNGTPVYGGFLSVELKKPNGVTLWSYLVTPGAASEDVSKDLAKRIAKHLPEALDLIEAPSPAGLPSQPTTLLNVAGATFPQPVYSKWFANYRRENPSVQITYDAIGSEAGIRKLLAGSVDFGASDSPEAIRELAPADESKYLFFPSVVGAVVPIVNLPGIPSDIAFTPEALAGIFLGKIKKWNDPVLKQANRSLRLPDLDILVVHRADGSGTSYAWTDYLSRTSSEWKMEVGSGLVPRWPTGRPATGNDGVAKLVKELGGSIGYVEFIYALQNHLGYGRVRNRTGEFVEASLESIAAAVSHAVEIHDDFKVSIVDAPGAGAYPITSFTWFVVPAHIPDDAKRSAISSFLRWMVGPGQAQAAALGYLALPREIVTKEEDAIARIH
jgi:phosphate transport system substrate-binding protein